MKKLLLLFPIIIAACSSPREQIADTSAYTEPYYTPAYSQNFKLKSLANDSTQLLLEIYRPDTMSVSIPRGGFQSIVCLSSTYIGFISECGEANRISGVSRVDLVTNPQVKANATEVGYDGAFDYEAILSVNPDIMLIYGINGPNPNVEKLKELGINYIYVHDFEEQHPLGRAEWLVALGALVGKDMRTEFAGIAAAYKPIIGKTKVMLNAPYSGAWFIPGEGNYMSKLIADAGGLINTPQPPGEKSQPIDLEIALPALHDSDIWLNPGQAANIAETKMLVPHAKFSGPIWNQQPDFYESGAARPDKILNELKHIFSNDESQTFHFFQRLE